jgi:hypothetical protein
METSIFDTDFGSTISPFRLSPGNGTRSQPHPISKRRAKFNDSHATLDPDRACSAAQDDTLSLSKAVIRLTQMMKAGHTFLYVRCVTFNLRVPDAITPA